MKYGYVCHLSVLALLAGTGLARAEDITIAVAGPMTGAVASIGEQLKNGAELAAQAINQKGGVNGQTVKIVVYDDACDPKQAVAVANRIVSDGIKFVDGHACSGSSIPASEVYAEADVLMMSPASSNPAMTDKAAEQGWSTIMRLYGRDDAQGKFIGPWIKQNYGTKKIGILHDKSAYGKGLADVVKASLNNAGVKEVLYEGINAGEKDYKAVVNRLKSQGVEFLYFGGYHTEAGLIMRQAADQGYKFQLMMGDSIATPEFGAVAGPAADGTLFTFPPDGRDSDAAKGALEQFQKIGFVPEGFTLFSYATVQAIAGGIAKAGSRDPKAVAKTLRDTNVDTVLGPVTFDEKGDIKNPKYNINVWKGGTYSKLTQ
ncbi:branched-chain amino acid ABC transporter substrate-binding protein [Microvirga mediterraneensis]|uniref:Branched-chain amino acid ABC transporter substrate-binding protein n=1 Tax=Microvirga mediterraneensis TaxID=2754695 RepID=A0A838BRX6_9HYPH|nr:branched-chain amino acid ABC transporter substrate-binding protein [Microvirga mediterraneensis]MBA1157732.1 branched-chain amino acid ABC transporter substrate-binding protein [Microvirga mediterraneensis]